ncbi:TRAP transporter substrate-binding protein [Escherichia coli]|uniref:TRAP transporter substrate-binding protein n=1 Tax=Escherichia coli TaxID=562 RepID=UPI0039875B16
MKIKVSAGIIGAVLMLSASQSWAVTLKLSHNQDKSHPVHKAMEFFAKKSKEYSNGDITILIYPMGTLGTQRETMELIRSGAIPLVKTNAAEMEAFENWSTFLILPYLFRDRDHYYQVMQGDIGRKILDSTKSSNLLGFRFRASAARSFYGNKPGPRHNDLKGMKVRVQPSPGAVGVIVCMGGNLTPANHPDLWTALQQGVVDMAENSVMALTTMRHKRMVKSFSLDEHTMVPDVDLMSNAAFDKLSQENQAVILKAAKESMSYMKDLWSEEEKQELAKLDKMGVKVYQVDKAPFIEKVQPMYAYLTKNSPALAPMLADIQAAK